MIFDGLEFYNIEEMSAVEGFAGRRLQRVPESVRTQLDPGTAGTMLSPSGAEIRFRIAPGKDSVTLRLSAELPTKVYVYFGPFQGPMWDLDKEPREYVLKQPPRMKIYPTLAKPHGGFDSRLVRICFGGAYPEPVFYHGHGDGCEPPRPGDAPARRYLAYGSSITHGADHGGAAISFPAHAAWRLGLDLRNLGASGCCLCEPAIADYLAQQKCAIATLELAVNMIGKRFNNKDFRERAGYLVDRIAASDPTRPVVCITIFPHFRDIDPRFIPAGDLSTTEDFRRSLREIVGSSRHRNLSLVEGSELLPDIEYLTTDLIHPGARGTIQIGEELARRIKPLLREA